MVGKPWQIVVWLLVIWTESVAIDVRIGQAFTLTIPGYAECGQYALLGPSLTPVVIIAGENASKVIGQYIDRVLMDQTKLGFNMTMYDVTKADGGKYKVVASSSSAGTKRVCSDNVYDVVIKAASDEFLMDWGQWTPCKSACDARENRFRQRNCSIPDGCHGMGATMETETCEKAPECAHWTSWGSWGACSAKCGKGFKIRKRACVKSSSAFVESSACKGQSTVSHMCMTVCEFIGIWSGWSDWSACSVTCGGNGTRSRSRECLKDERVTVDCEGNRADTETCNNGRCGVIVTTPSKPTTLPPIPVPKTPKTTPTSDELGSTTSAGIGPTTETNTQSADSSIGTHDTSKADEDEDDSLTLIVIIGIACLLAMSIIIILIIVLKKRAERRKQNDANIADMRPKDQMTVRRQKRSREEEKKKNDDKIAKGNSVNVYSEMSSSSNSNLAWNSADFDMLGDIAENDAEAENAENEGKSNANSCDNSNVSLVFDDSEFDDESNNETVERSDAVAEGIDTMYCLPPEVECVTGAEKKVYTKVNHVSYDPSKYDDDVEHIYEPSPDDKQTITLEDSPMTTKKISVSYSKVNRDSKKKLDTTVTEDINENVYENCETYKRDPKKKSIKDKIKKEIGSKLLAADTHKTVVPKSPKSSPDHSSRDLPPPPYGDVNSLKNTKVPPKGERSIKGSPNKKKWSNLDNEHTYANEKVSADTEYFYVTPKMVGNQQPMERKGSEEHIYDTPKPF